MASKSGKTKQKAPEGTNSSTFDATESLSLGNQNFETLSIGIESFAFAHSENTPKLPPSPPTTQDIPDIPRNIEPLTPISLDDGAETDDGGADMDSSISERQGAEDLPQSPTTPRTLKKSNSLKKDKKVPSPRSSARKVPTKSPEMLAHEEISTNSQRRLEIKVRTRKLLARKASHRETQQQLTRRLSELDEVIKTVDEPAEFDVARQELEAMITDEWDPTGKLRAMLLRLSWHSVATYDPHTEDHTTAGGTNNGGYGGATMRFAPESEDEKNRGLLVAAERLLGPIKTRHPRLSHADLWVLSSYVVIASLGGPYITFRGGRFDAKDGSRCPRNASGESRLLLDDYYGDMDRTTLEMNLFRERLKLDDAEFVALIMGTQGLNKGRQPDTRGPVWNEEMAEFAPCVSMLADGLWREINKDSNARFLEPLRPEEDAVHFIHIGNGFEGEVEPWATLPITPTDNYELDEDISQYPKMEGGTEFVFINKKLKFLHKSSEKYTVIAYELRSGGWLHDFDPSRPNEKAAKMCAGGEATIMLHPREMSLHFHPPFKKWVDEYNLDRDLLKIKFGEAFKKVTELGLRKGSSLVKSLSSKTSFEESEGKLEGTVKFLLGDFEQTHTCTFTSEHGGDFVAMFRNQGSAMLKVRPEMGQLRKGEPMELTVTYTGGGAPSSENNLRLLVETEQEDFQFIIVVEADEGTDC